MTKIGVFDSGIGGLSVARAVEQALPDETIIYVNDREHVPYGDKTPGQLLRFIMPILEDLVAQGCELLVIACNTATTVLAETLRARLPVPIVGIEPMVKPAAQLTKTGVIGICATPGTLASKRYAWLKRTYASQTRVLEPDCSDWARMIEDNQVNHEHIRTQINDLCTEGADVIVLGCTHYHWIEEAIVEMARGRAQIIQPETAIVAQVKKILANITNT
jgi:glutamate racemase